MGIEHEGVEMLRGMLPDEFLNNLAVSESEVCDEYYTQDVLLTGVYGGHVIRVIESVGKDRLFVPSKYMVVDVAVIQESMFFELYADELYELADRLHEGLAELLEEVGYDSRLGHSYGRFPSHEDSSILETRRVTLLKGDFEDATFVRVLDEIDRMRVEMKYEMGRLGISI